jgi:broad-specificity NMP kinase
MVKKSPKIIVVTGTPGTGKTTFSKKLALSLGFHYLDVNTLIKPYNLAESFDSDLNCSIVDESLLENAIRCEIALNLSSSLGLVIDSHLSHYLSSDFVDLCIVISIPINLLKSRLESRGYSSRKIRENLDSEIFDLCYVESLELGHNVLKFSGNSSQIPLKLINSLI